MVNMVVFVFVKKKSVREILDGKSVRVRKRLYLSQIRFVADSVCACVNHIRGVQKNCK